MEFKAKREILFEATQKVSGVIPRTSTRPAIQNMLFDVNTDHILLIGTDLEVEMIIKIAEGIEIIDTGKVLVPAFQVVNILRELIDKDVTFKLSEDGLLEIKTSSSYFKLNTIDPMEFPEMQTPNINEEYKINEEIFLDLINKAGFSANRELKQIATDGILVEFKEGVLSIVSTDGKRLSFGEKKIKSIKGDYEVILPQKAINILKRVLSEGKKINIKISDNTCIFERENIRITTLQIEGKFPDYKRVIPKEHGSVLKVNREELLRAIRQAMVVAEIDHMGIVLSTEEKDKLYISADSIEGGSGKTEISAKVKDVPVKIKVNGSFLMDVLKVLDEEDVELEIFEEEAKKPIVIKTKGYIYLIMPLTTR